MSQQKDVTALLKVENASDYPLSINTLYLRGLDSTSGQNVTKQVSQSGLGTDVQIPLVSVKTEYQCTQLAAVEDFFVNSHVSSTSVNLIEHTAVLTPEPQQVKTSDATDVLSNVISQASHSASNTICTNITECPTVQITESQNKVNTEVCSVSTKSVDDHIVHSEACNEHYNCDICGQTFSHFGLYGRHMWKHTGDKQHKCDICSNEYVTASSLNRHKVKVHTDKNLSVCNSSAKLAKNFRKQTEGQLYSCDKYHRAFKELQSQKKHACISTAETKTHQKVKSSHTSDTCSVTYVSKAELQNHDVKFLTNSYSSLKCMLCKKTVSTFMTLEDLKQHKRLHDEKLLSNRENCGETVEEISMDLHPKMNTDAIPEKKRKYKINPCPHCDKMISGVNNLYRHIRCVHKKDVKTKASVVHECDICGDKFKNIIHYDRHMFNHTSEKKYQCTICRKLYMHRRVLLDHQRRGHSNKKPLACDVCDKSFFRKSDLKVRMRTHRGEKLYLCEICSSAFSTFAGLASHKTRKHSKDKLPFQCGQCGKRFTLSNELKQHQCRHTGEKPYKCDFCEKTFCTGKERKRHQTIHTREKSFKCRYCGRAFRQRSNLTSHQLSHSNKRAFKCSVCKASFKLPSHLKRHLQTHTGEKPFKCEFCEKTFCTGNERKQHQTIHSGEKPFKCKYCGKAFRLRSNLTSHQLSHSNRRSFKCSICTRSFKLSSHLKRHQRTHSSINP